MVGSNRILIGGGGLFPITIVVVVVMMIVVGPDNLSFLPYLLAFPCDGGWNVILGGGVKIGDGTEW